MIEHELHELTLLFGKIRKEGGAEMSKSLSMSYQSLHPCCETWTLCKNLINADFVSKDVAIQYLLIIR